MRVASMVPLHFMSIFLFSLSPCLQFLQFRSSLARLARVSLGKATAMTVKTSFAQDHSQG